MHSLKYIITIFLLFNSIGIFAQTIVEPQTLTIEDGLSQGYISVIHQDEEGFLWIGTKNGLNRYDGEEFEVFTNDPDDPYSISNDWVGSIHEEGDFLIIGTFGANLNLFHKRSKRFYKIPLQTDQVEDFVFFKNLIKISSNKFWLIPADENQLIELVLPDQFWEKLPLDELLLKQVTQRVVIRNLDQIRINYEGQLQIKKGSEFLKLNPNTQKQEQFNSNDTLELLGNFISVNPSIKLQLSATSTTILKLLILKQGQWEDVAVDMNLSDIYFFEKDPGRLWLQEKTTNELLIFDTATIFTKTRIGKKDALFMINNFNERAISWVKDRSDIIWIGTGGLGIRKISPRKLNIKTFQTGVSIYTQIFSSSPGEILYHNPTTKGFYKAGAGHKLEYVHQFILSNQIDRWCWLNDGPGQGWLATIKPSPKADNDTELIFYRHRDNSLEEVKKVSINEFWNESNISILKGIDQQIYICFSNTVIRYYPDTEQHQTFTFDLFEQPYPYLFTSAQTANGDIWIGTSKGLIRAVKNQEDLRFELIQKDLRNLICASLLTDPLNPDILWIGTKGGGLHRLDTRSMKFEYLNTKNGLPNDVIYAVLDDSQGNIWMSSNKGIIRYTPQTELIKNFTSEDGLQSDEFNTYAYGKSPNGELLFGGINGLNVFFPEDLKDNPFVPNAYFTSLSVNNKKVSVSDSDGALKEAIEYNEAITLPYSKNSVSLTFAALEYTAPRKNLFSYYLENAEEEWVHESTDNKAQYLNVAPGSYIFKLKVANGDGVWNEKVRSLSITILPPWYRSNLAYLLYILLIGCSAWAFVHFQRKRLELHHRLELEHKESERLKELETFRSRLYTNITHEFRTPLTIISGMADQINSKPDIWLEKGIKMIKENSASLLNLVNQILDLRKLESKSLQLNLIQGDIVSYLKYLTESYKSFAQYNGLELHFLTEVDAVKMDYDPDKILRIISNLLSNAIKFTPDGGHIYFQISEKSYPGNKLHQLLIRVKDTGSGIPTDQLPYIFDRFYQVDDSGTRKGEGTGIGLALTKELVKLMNGEIEVTSEVDKGSTFSITLPITNDSPVTESFATDIKILTPADSEEKDIVLTATVNEEDSMLPNLLIVEDNADVVQFLVACLEEDYHLQIANNGQEGIDLAIEQIPDLIVSDVMMPEKDGFELCDILKQDERTSHIPIILLTAKADMDSKISGLERGADAYLAKPFEPKELLVRLKKLLELRQKLQERYRSIGPSSNEAPSNIEDIFIQKVRQAIAAKLSDSEYDILRLTRDLGMSRSQVFRKTKALTGKSPSLFIRSCRLNEGKKLLATTDLTISEIAYEVGFSSVQYFSDAFLEEFGERPSATRK